MKTVLRVGTSLIFFPGVLGEDCNAKDAESVCSYMTPYKMSFVLLAGAETEEHHGMSFK
jgi:hypothetical protein